MEVDPVVYLNHAEHGLGRGNTKGRHLKRFAAANQESVVAEAFGFGGKVLAAGVASQGNLYFGTYIKPVFASTFQAFWVYPNLRQGDFDTWVLVGFQGFL